MKKISIITVCFNCKNNIEKTLYSILMQKYIDYEYIIIDGKSSDGTLDVVKNYQNRIKNMIIVSEPDGGIYDAMNKGIKMASGDYIIFMNAGDVFYNNSVLVDVSMYLDLGKDIYWGNVKKKDHIETYPNRITKCYLILREKMVCHQAIFAKRELLESCNFDTSFKICADRDWFIKSLFILKSSFLYMKDIIVCDYDCFGVSSSNYRLYCIESERISKKYYGYIGVVMIKVKRFIGRLLGHKW